MVMEVTSGLGSSHGSCERLLSDRTFSIESLGHRGLGRAVCRFEVSFQRRHPREKASKVICLDPREERRQCRQGSVPEDVIGTSKGSSST